jgi:outer membrane protein
MDETRRWVTRGLTLLICAGLATTGLEAQAPIKVAVFDPQRVSEETEVGRLVQVELTQLRDRKQSEIATMELGIQELQTTLSQQELSLSADRRSQMEREIQTAMLQLQSAREVAGRELQMQVAAAQSSFEDKLLRAVQAYGREEGMTLVLARDLVAFADGTIDSTDAIIQRFNQMFPGTGQIP